MATWHDLVAFVSANWKIAEQDQSKIKLLFDVGDGRSQAVWVWRTTRGSDSEEWIQIESPIGAIDELSLADLVRETEGMVCGAIAFGGGVVTFRHSAPLATLDAGDFTDPLTMVTVTADQLEEKFVGQDRF